VSETPGNKIQHLDEMTCLLYIERQIDRTRAQEVSLHAQECASCRTLLHALERESRLLTRAMLEEEEPLPARLAEFQERARRSVQWVWGVVFGLAATGAYALYTGYVEPWQQQLEQAGFGGSNLLSLLIFQGAFWKGWQSMITLLEVVALLTLAGFGLTFFRRRIRRSSVLALVLAGFCTVLALPGPASASEFRKGESTTINKEETINGDLFLTCGGRGHVDGTVDGDLFFFGQGLDVNGHVTGDVIVFAASVRINGQVDGNVRSFANNLTISGNVGKNVLAFNEVLNLDSAGKVGGSLTTFVESLGLDGRLGRDLFAFFQHASISGTIGGDVRAKGNTVSVSPTAVIAGPFRFEGNTPPEVSPQAKLASPVEYHKLEHKPRYMEGHYYVWRIIWTAAYILFGLALFLLVPKFAGETISAAERYGAPIGLGVLVFFGVPIAAIVACVTVVGIPLGILAIGFWILMLNCAEIVVGTVVGNWILGHATDTWEMIGRMALGFAIVRILYTPLAQVHVLGSLVGLGIWVWGMGAISLALYRRIEPVISPGASSPPLASPPLPPHTTVGGQPA
jgi:cytoskeletal protein CcmA (bactofilin family)